jgi:hypothetical protein
VDQIWYQGTGFLYQNLTAGGPAGTSDDLTSYLVADGAHVYYIATDQDVNQLWWTGSTWLNQDITAGVGGPPAMPGGGMTNYSGPDGQHVFYIDANQNINQLWWTGQTEIAQNLTAGAGAPITAPGSPLTSFALSDNIPHIVYIDTNNHVEQLWWQGTGFVHQDLTAMTGGPAAGGGSIPDPPPAPYPDELMTPPTAPSGSCNITGVWADSLSGATWSLVQTSSGSVSGTLSLAGGSCGNVTWTVVGQASSGLATLNASNPSPPVNLCEQPAATSVTANATFSNCSSGLANETAVIPAGGSGFGSGAGPSGGTNTGTGNLTLISQPLTFTMNSPSQIPIPGATNSSQMIPMSTGDTIPITTTASNGSYPVSVVYSSPLEGNPDSDCAMSLSIPAGQGAGSATSNMSASQAGCSGIFGVYGAVGGTTTGNALDVVVPPQLLIQMLYGEAHGQAVTGDVVSELAIGATIRNRINDTVWYHGVTSWQTAITAKQFDAIKTCQAAGTCVQTGTVPEVTNAALLYGGVTTPAMDVDNARCFFTPDHDGWVKIQGTLNKPSITVVPTVAGDPGCFPIRNRQFVYKTSIGNNADGRGAPAFILVQLKALSDPAVIEIP